MNNEEFDFNSAKQYRLKQYGEVYTIVLEETTYVTGTYAIVIYSLSDDGTYWENFDVLTMNLPDSSKVEGYAYIQADKYLDFVLKNEIGKPTGRIAKSGFNCYDEIKFNVHNV